MDGIVFLHYLEAAIPPLSFLLILWALLKSKYSRRVTVWTALGFLAAEAAVQGVLFALDGQVERLAGLLPLTLYLPAILCLYLLSDRRFFSTTLTWLLALLCDHVLAALRKLLVPSPVRSIAEAAAAALLLAAAGLLVALVYRFLRRPFQVYAEGQTTGWLPILLLPLMLLALYSYFLASATNTVAIFLLFFTALSALLVLVRLINILPAEYQIRESRQQMAALRQDYSILQKKLELGRSYRHDMRHHMAALTVLLQQGDCSAAQRYIADWQGQLTQIETDAWCRNTAVNGVLSAYLSQAREIGCELDVNVAIPEVIPFEELDLCVVLANALENAVLACEELPAGAPRRLKLSAALTDQRRLTVRVENTCLKPLKFDEKGLPIGPHREGHGQGLKSIATVAEKYHGVFQCSCTGGMFILRVALLDGAPKPRPLLRRAGAVGAFVLLLFFLLNAMPTLAQELEGIPGLGTAVRIVDLRTYDWNWGDTGISIHEPVLGGDELAVSGVDMRKEEFMSQMQEQFHWYAARKYQGYVAQDTGYKVLRDDEDLFAIRFYTTINVGGSVNYSRCITLDQSTGQILTLADLFLPDSNYIFPISREIRAQMEEQNNAGTARYFLPGDIWPDEECFDSIDADQNFYINDDDQLVIVFDEYEVAAGSMGMPEFVIPTDLLNGLLAQPSFLH